MKDKMFWFLLIFGIVLLLVSSIYYTTECSIFETDWYANILPECRISGSVGTFSVGVLIATISLWLVGLTEEKGE
jgi:hypothetical protein